jgi:hypothetical protein
VSLNDKHSKTIYMPWATPAWMIGGSSLRRGWAGLGWPYPKTGELSHALILTLSFHKHLQTEVVSSILIFQLRCLSLPSHAFYVPYPSKSIDTIPPPPKLILCAEYNVLLCPSSQLSTCTLFSRYISFGIATGYGVDNRMIEIRFLAVVDNFSPRYHVQTDSGAHPASYPMGTEGSFFVG